MGGAERKIYTDSNLDAYSEYIPDEWGEKHIGPIPEGTVLERLLLDIAVLWRTVSYTAQMPSSSIRGMHASAVGRSKFVSPDKSVVRLADQIVEELRKRVPALIRSKNTGKIIGKELEKIGFEYRERLQKVMDDYPIEPIWAEFMKLTAFRLSVWSSQRVAYVCFYNAYEGFLVDCVKVATGETLLKTTNDSFRKGLRSSFSKDIADACWFHPEILRARLVRHALSHNGGRLTKDLRNLTGIKLDVKVIDNELQVIPKDNHDMLMRLRSAVEEIIAVTSNDSKFMAPASSLPETGGPEE